MPNAWAMRALAERLADALRQSSWWGRHPLIGFCLLPPLEIILLMALIVLVAYLTFLAHLDWAGGAIPLLCAAVVVARQRRVARGLTLTF